MIKSLQIFEKKLNKRDYNMLIKRVVDLLNFGLYEMAQAEKLRIKKTLLDLNKKDWEKFIKNL